MNSTKGLFAFVAVCLTAWVNTASADLIRFDFSGVTTSFSSNSDPASPFGDPFAGISIAPGTPFTGFLSYEAPVSPGTTGPANWSIQVANLTASSFGSAHAFLFNGIPDVTPALPQVATTYSDKDGGNLRFNLTDVNTPAVLFQIALTDGVAVSFDAGVNYSLFWTGRIQAITTSGAAVPELGSTSLLLLLGLLPILAKAPRRLA